METLQGVLIGPHHNWVDEESRSSKWKAVSPNLLGRLRAYRFWGLGTIGISSLLFPSASRRHIPRNPEAQWPQPHPSTWVCP